MTADQTAKGTIFYDSYVGNVVPVWDGSVMQLLTIVSDEISLILDATGHVIASVYDVFAYSASGTLTLGTGPVWTSTTGRGTGAGTTELQLKNGVWTNKNAIVLRNNSVNTSSIPANQATYLGSFYTTAAGQTGMAFKPAAAGGGSNSILGLYNGYNRVVVQSVSRDNTGSWTYGSTVWRGQNNNNSNRVSFVDGLQQSPIRGAITDFCSISTTANSACLAMNLDSTSNTPNVVAKNNGAPIISVGCEELFSPQLGFHFVQAMERRDATTAQTATYFGAASGDQVQMLNVQLAL
jgi:hypothetical protein